MTYYAVNSTDSGNNTGWVFATPANYFAFNSIDEGHNRGWIFENSPILVNTSASRDANRIATVIAMKNTVEAILIPLYANPSNNGMEYNDGTTGNSYGTANALRDANRVTGIMAVSSTDGVTPVALYIDPKNNGLLIKST